MIETRKGHYIRQEQLLLCTVLTAAPKHVGILILATSAPHIRIWAVYILVLETVLGWMEANYLNCNPDRNCWLQVL